MVFVETLFIDALCSTLNQNAKYLFSKRAISSLLTTKARLASKVSTDRTFQIVVSTASLHGFAINIEPVSFFVSRDLPKERQIQAVFHNENYQVFFEKQRLYRRDEHVEQ